MRLRRLRLCLRVRRRRALTPSLPERGVLEAQAEVLAPMRARVLRRLGIAHRGPVLDLGAGPGVITAELRRRSKGPVIAFDRDRIVHDAPADECVVGDATELPFDSGRFDLVFAQYLFLWNDADARYLIAREVARVLAPTGVLVAVEPDYGGAMEHPREIAIAPIIARGIRRAGGEPEIGRRLGAELSEVGLEVRIEQGGEFGPPDPRRFHYASGLGLTEAEAAAVAQARAADARLPAAIKLAYVPQLFFTAGR